jgi:hypothetical protein
MSIGIGVFLAYFFGACEPDEQLTIEVWDMS